MAFNQLSNRSSLSWLFIVGFMSSFAYFQYTSGYDYAEEHLISQEALCDDAFGKGRRSLRLFKVMGCKSQVQDRQKKLESRLGFESSNLSDKELMHLMQRDLIEREKRSGDIEKWLARCDGDVEACMEDTPQDNGFDPAPSASYESHTPLSPEECDEVDNAGFLPECRGW